MDEELYLTRDESAEGTDGKLSTLGQVRATVGCGRVSRALGTVPRSERVVIDERATEFAEACGAVGPVDLRIQRTDGLVLAEGALNLPCALIGRDHDCEIVLTDPEVALRHALLQVVGGRVLMVDLGTRAGLRGAAGGDGFAWLTPTGAARIGPFHIFLRGAVSAFPAPLDRIPNPLQPAPIVVQRLPRTVLQFLNGKSVKSTWPVNRLVTLIGRAKECKISLSAEDVANRHAYLLLTPAGLWVVDLLSPTGTWVNGNWVRFARLRQGDEVQVGPFALACHYPDGEPQFPAADPPTGFRLPKILAKTNPPLAGMTSPDDTRPDVPLGSLATPGPVVSPAPFTRFVQEEVPGVQAPMDTQKLGPVKPAPEPASPAPTATKAAVVGRSAARPIAVTPLINQMEMMNGQMVEQFQQSFVTLFSQGQLAAADFASVQMELARVTELNAELQRLQEHLLRRTLPPEAAMVSSDRANQWVGERIAAIQGERQKIWQKLFNMMGGTP